MEKLTSPPAQYEVPDLPESDVHSLTLGKAAVHMINESASAEVKAGMHQDWADYRQRLKNTKEDPSRYGRVQRKIGQVRGTVMTGAEAVQIAGLQRSRSNQEFHAASASAWKSHAARKINHVSEELTHLDNKSSKLFDKYMEQYAPEFLKNAKITSEGGAGTLPWAQYLGANNPVAGQKYGEGPLTNFLQWHVHNMEQQQQDPEFQAMIAQWKVEYKAALAEGAKDGGWIGSKVPEALKKVDETQVYAGDIFDTLLKGMEAYHAPGSKEIVLSLYTSNFDEETGFKLRTSKDIKKTSFHEGGHAVLQDPDNDLPIMSEHWLYEALTEHTTVSLLNGKTEIVNPYDRDDGFTYEYQRLLLYASLKGVHPFIATRAYSGNQEEQMLFEKAVDEAWGQERMLQKISRTVRLYEKKYSQDRVALVSASISAGHGPGVMMSPVDAAAYMTERALISGVLDIVSEGLERELVQKAGANKQVAARQAESIQPTMNTAQSDIRAKLADALIAAGSRGKRPSYKSRAQRPLDVNKHRKPGQKVETEVRQEFAKLRNDKGDQKALKSMLKKYHPDVNPDNKIAEEKAKIVSGMLDDFNKAQGSATK